MSEPADEGRRRHYGQFYGLEPLPDRGLPLLVVWGNCLAESVRVCLGSHAHEPDLDTVRIPPVHELTAEDLPHVRRLLARTTILMAQPVRDGYRDLPLGTDEAAALMPSGARVELFPSVRDNAAHPYQALVHGDGLSDPPVSPYHDLRLIAATAGLPGGPDSLEPEELVAAWRQIGADSVATMARRATEQGTLDVHDVVQDAPGRFWTLNHPDNHLILTLTSRLRGRLGLDDSVADPGRVLLGSVRAPVDADVVAALDLPRPPVSHWLIEGSVVEDEAVRAAHTKFYAEHPGVVAAGVETHADRLRLLGWRL